jgi:hypothetical protein
MSFLETPEYLELKRQQDAELAKLLDSKNTRRQRRRMAIRHVNEFKRYLQKWAKREVNQ